MGEELLRGVESTLLEETILTKVREGKVIPISHGTALTQEVALDHRPMAEDTVISSAIVQIADQLKVHHNDQMVREMKGEAHHRDLHDTI